MKTLASSLLIAIGILAWATTQAAADDRDVRGGASASAPSVNVRVDTPSGQVRTDVSVQRPREPRRYRWYGSRWWYWLPNREWVFWSDDRGWIFYNSGSPYDPAFRPRKPGVRVGVVPGRVGVEAGPVGVGVDPGGVHVGVGPLGVDVGGRR